MVSHIKGLSYLSDYEAVNTVWSLFRWGQKGGNEYNKVFIVLLELYEYVDLIINFIDQFL